MRFAWIAAEKAGYPMGVLCRCLDVTRSGYYAWAARGASRRTEVDQQLTRQLRVAHADSRGTYGRPRLHQVLRARGIRVSAKRIARLMQAARLVARGRRRYRVTTDSAHADPIAPNRLQRRFRVTRLNTVWAADITACPTRGGLVLPRGDSRSRLAPRGRLGGPADARHHGRDHRLDARAERPTSDPAAAASFRPRLPICERRLSSAPRGRRRPGQHESRRELLGQRPGRKLLQHAQNGIAAAAPLGRLAGGSRRDCRLHRRLSTTGVDYTRRSATSVPSPSKPRSRRPRDRQSVYTKSDQAQIRVIRG